MSIQYTITRTLTVPGGVNHSASVQKTADAEQTINSVVPQNQTNLLYALAIDVSQLQMLYISADAAMTLKTNSSGSPADTITLAANQAVEWAVGDAGACPLTVDVTALYVTTGAIGSAGGTLKLFALIDPTV